MNTENKFLKKFMLIALTISLLFSTTACGVKLVAHVEKTEEETPAEVQPDPTAINTNVDENDTFEPPKEETEDVDEKKEQTATSTTQNQNISDQENSDPSISTHNGIKFKKLDPNENLYANEDVVPIFSNGTLTRHADNLILNQEVKATARSLDGDVTQITSDGTFYYVDSDFLSSNPVKVIDNTQQNNNSNNNSNSGNNNSGNYNNNNSGYNDNSGNYQQPTQQPQQTQPVCSGVCWPGGSADTTIAGIGCKYTNMTAYIAYSDFIYESPVPSGALEKLYNGETLNITAICSNNYVQVLLATGQYVYFNGQNLR